MPEENDDLQAPPPEAPPQPQGAENEDPKPKRQRSKKEKAAEVGIRIACYNPDDDPIRQTYGGHEFILQPETATEITSPFKDGTTANQLADFIVNKWGEYGVVKITNAMDDDEVEKAIAEATETYLKATLKWSIKAVTDGNKVAFEVKSHGLPAPAKSVDHQRAEAWLAKNDKRLRSAGLIQ